MPISHSRKWRPDLETSGNGIPEVSISIMAKSKKNMKHVPTSRDSSDWDFYSEKNRRILNHKQQQQHQQFAVSHPHWQGTDLSDSNRTPLPVQSTKGTTAAVTSLRVMAVMVRRCAKYVCSTSCFSCFNSSLVPLVTLLPAKGWHETCPQYMRLWLKGCCNMWPLVKWKLISAFQKKCQQNLSGAKWITQ